jgi:energy-converting hydrogenase Eha subunit E
VNLPDVSKDIVKVLENKLSSCQSCFCRCFITFDSELSAFFFLAHLYSATSILLITVAAFTPQIEDNTG